MNDLPSLVLFNIFAYINNCICCKNINDLSILISNKYLSNFYKKNFKYKFNRYIDLSKYESELRSNSNYFPKNYKFCLSDLYCNLFDKEEILKLKKIIESKCRNDKLKKNREKICLTTNKYKVSYPSIFIHFQSEENLLKFQMKIITLRVNIRLSSRHCCNGKGCEVFVI